MISPTCNLYKIVVFPAPFNPKIKILISWVPNRLENTLERKKATYDELPVFPC